MIKVHMEFDSLESYLKSLSDRPDREKVESGLFNIGWEQVHDELGDYDRGLDGFLVYKDPSTETLWRIDFYEDSYSSGYLSGVQKVTAKTIQKVVYE